MHGIAVGQEIPPPNTIVWWPTLRGCTTITSDDCFAALHTAVQHHDAPPNQHGRGVPKARIRAQAPGSGASTKQPCSRDGGSRCPRTHVAPLALNPPPYTAGAMRPPHGVPVATWQQGGARAGMRPLTSGVCCTRASGFFPFSSLATRLRHSARFACTAAAGGDAGVDGGGGGADAEVEALRTRRRARAGQSAAAAEYGSEDWARAASSGPAAAAGVGAAISGCFRSRFRSRGGPYFVSAGWEAEAGV